MGQVYLGNNMVMIKSLLFSLFSKYAWFLRMTASVSKILKFGFTLKNWPKNMYHMFILKNDQLPDLIHDHVDLDVHLDPQDGLERLRNHKR